MRCYVKHVSLYSTSTSLLLAPESTVSPSARIRLNGMTMTQKQHINNAAAANYIGLYAEFPFIRHIDCLLQFASHDDHPISSTGGRAMFRRSSRDRRAYVDYCNYSEGGRRHPRVGRSIDVRHVGLMQPAMGGRAPRSCPPPSFHSVL